MSFENLYDEQQQAFGRAVSLWRKEVQDRPVSKRDLTPRLMGYVDSAGVFRELSPNVRIARALRADYYRLHTSNSNFVQVSAWVYAKCN